MLVDLSIRINCVQTVNRKKTDVDRSLTRYGNNAINGFLSAGQSAFAGHGFYLRCGWKAAVCLDREKEKRGKFRKILLYGLKKSKKRMDVQGVQGVQGVVPLGRKSDHEKSIETVAQQAG